MDLCKDIILEENTKPPIEKEERVVLKFPQLPNRGPRLGNHPLNFYNGDLVVGFQNTIGKERPDNRGNHHEQKNYAKKKQKGLAKGSFSLINESSLLIFLQMEALL